MLIRAISSSLIGLVPAFCRVGYLAMARMARELSEIVGRTVDLRTPAELHRAFRERVQAEAFVEYAAA